MKKRRTYRTFLVLLILMSVLGAGIWHTSMSIRKADIATGDAKGFDEPARYSEYFRGISVPFWKEDPGYAINYRMKEHQRSKRRSAQQLKSSTELPWVQRGPWNVGGRTRALVVDPDDPTNSTWYAGSASGGIWKTTDAGQNWEILTDDFPTLAHSALVMAPSNHNVMYAGSGEGFSTYPGVVGAGIFKSLDKGITWENLESTLLPEFSFVNKLAIDPDNEDILLACTDAGIFKTKDGGTTWDKVFQNGLRVQDIAVSPNSFDTMYAAVNTLGIIKSTDAGESWDFAFDGIGSAARFSVDVSPVNTSWVFALAEAENNVTDLYVSTDAAMNWNKFRDADTSFLQVLGSQGYYNNIVRAHPYNQNEVFLGGVSISKVRFLDSLSESSPRVVRVDTVGTGTFMGFINFGGPYLGGGMSTGDLEDGIEIEAEDWSSVEIRFGPGKKQKAYRFTVPPGRGPGVEPILYTYHDYIDVPFEVWDTDRDRQLMVSFRDQERDSVFNLIERDPDNEIPGREYIFVQAVPYDSVNVDTNIAKNGGHIYKQLYFYWPTLVEDGFWNADSLPASGLSVTYGTFRLQDVTTTIVSSGYEGVNANLHVDHHEMIMIPTDPASKKFSILNANDGGLGYSTNNGGTWEQITDGYITTQYYGVAKKKGAHEYIGGMQDNGTWQSASGQEAVATTPHNFRVGGDGFETVWNAGSPSKIIASNQYNGFYLSKNGGSSWEDATTGLGTDGPFFSRLAYHPKKPDRLYTVGGDGVYRSTKFGEKVLREDAWELLTTGSNWYLETLGNTYYNVEVSLADPDIIWAGTAMFRDPDLDIYVSSDGGDNWSPAGIYDDGDLGVITAIATHPNDPDQAFLLFSYARSPKILRTRDRGETWADITGFSDSEVSTNGFPDVMTLSLLVPPTGISILWAGTEIGLFESRDDGETWYYADNGLPAVAIWDMFAQDGHIVLATHGRGIWTVPLETAVNTEEREAIAQKDLIAYPNPASGQVRIELENAFYGEVDIRLFNVNGGLQRQYQAGKYSESWSESLDLSGIPSGNYIIRLDCGGARYDAQLVVVD